MASDHPQVTILGAGVAGLTAALALRRRAGVEQVRVLERDQRGQHRPGHGLLLMPNGVRALQTLGLEQVLEGQRPLTAALLQSDCGTVVHREPLEGIYCLTRLALVEALGQQLPTDTVQRGCGVTDIELQPSPLLRFADGTSQQVDGLLVGAEGIRSPLCAALNPGFVRTPSRVFEVVTSSELPDLASLLGSQFIKTLFPSRGLAFGLLAPSSTRVIGFLQFDTQRYAPPADTSAQGLAAFVKALMADAPEPVSSYLHQADWLNAHLWRPVDADLPPRLSAGQAVLIGDAAHPLLPFTSQGVSAALEDAVLLADALTMARTDRRPLADVLSGLMHDRRHDLQASVQGGRAILQAFVEPPAATTLPYVDGSASPLEEHLRLPLSTLLDLFRLLDRNGNGSLEPPEWQRLLELLALPPDEHRALFGLIDANQDRRISYGELVQALASQDHDSPLNARLRVLLTPRGISQSHRRVTTLELLRQCDSNGDGLLDLDEFCSALALLGMVCNRTSAAQRFDTLDRDGNGQLSLQELVQASELIGAMDPDPLFADGAINRPLLNQLAFNYRWATHPDGVIPLTAAESDFAVAEVIREAIARHAADGYLCYLPPAGLPLLRETAAAHLSAKHGLALEADRVLVTDGAAAALFLAAKTLLRPGDEALIPDPGDFLLERSVLAAGGQVRRYRLEAANGYRLDAAALEALVTPRTRMITLCSPHNPLGRVWSRDELIGVAAVAERHNLMLLSDEVWSDIVHAPHRHIATASLDAAISRRTLTVYGLSKGYNLAGLRVGLLISPDTASHGRLLQAAHAHETVFGASVLSQVAAAAAYRDAGPWLERFVAHLTRRRDQALQRLRAMPGVRCPNPEGTYVVFPDISAICADQDRLVQHLLERHQLAVVPGSSAFFGDGARGHIRISTATSSALLEEGLSRLAAGLRSLV